MTLQKVLNSACNSGLGTEYRGFWLVNTLSQETCKLRLNSQLSER